MAEARIDVSIEHKNLPEEPAGGKKHPNTCPKCHSHYRDDELDRSLRVCTHCGHHFPVRARQRIEQLVDPQSFAEESSAVRSSDPLDFFDLRPYRERLAEAEVATGLGEAIVGEPGALIAFTGPRVVQQTTKEKLPDDFGLAEQNFRFGHLDAIVPRPEVRPYLSRLLRLFDHER